MKKESKNILVDSDFLFAYILEPDPNHLKAIRLFEKYGEYDWYILVPTLGELLTALSNKVNQQVAKKAYVLKDVIPLGLIYPGEYDWERAFEEFLRQSKKRTSVIDCLNLAYFKYGDLDFFAIASFDKFYGDLRLPGVDSKR